jgi:uncharacterized GH25 family protein
VQVGDSRSDAYSTALGYPAELIPLANPYALERGAPLRLRVLVDGAPVANQYVVAGGRTLAGGRIAAIGYRSDSAGIVHVPIRATGQWYVKFIHMVRAVADTAIDYESKWASLTFEVPPATR